MVQNPKRAMASWKLWAFGTVGGAVAVVAILSLTTLFPRPPGTQRGPIPQMPPVGSLVPVSHYAIKHIYPHDTEAFTEGLEYYEGFLFEGTGLEGHSTLRQVELTTGRVVQQTMLPQEYFGEGITLWGADIIQLTLKS